MIVKKERLTVTVDPAFIEAGNDAVAEGRVESLSAWVNAALAAKVAMERRLVALAEAVAAYERMIRDYPQSDILPEAWYKVGTAYERLGQPDRARAAYETAVKLFPETDAGRLSKQRLDGLNRRSR